jgi:hypothetical protein
LSEGFYQRHLEALFLRCSTGGMRLFKGFGVGGQWWKWPRGEAWELDMGAALRGTVVLHREPPNTEMWARPVNTRFLGYYPDLDEAKCRVETAIGRDMRSVLEDWKRFTRCAISTT